jgi:hypothetical protein
VITKSTELIAWPKACGSGASRTSSPAITNAFNSPFIAA